MNEVHYEVVPSVRYQHNTQPDYPDYEVLEHAGPCPANRHVSFGMCGQSELVYFATRKAAVEAMRDRNAASDRAWKLSFKTPRPTPCW